MHVTLLSGSRNPEGRTARACAALLEGVRDAGGTGEVTFLPSLRLERCRQCDPDGWGLCRREGRCVIEDDLAGQVDAMAGADAVVVATPVYFSDLAESVHTLLTRLRRTVFGPAGDRRLTGKPAVGLCVAGGGGGGAPAACARLETMLAQTGLDVLDMVPARRQNLEAKRRVLRDLGRDLARRPPPAP